MNNIFSQGQKTKLLDGSVTTSNAFQMSMDQMVMNNSQLNERLENLEKPSTFNDLVMEQKFQNMKLIDINTHKHLIQEPGMEHYWRDEQHNQILNNEIKGGFIPMNRVVSGQHIHPALLQFNQSLSNEKPSEEKEELHNPNEIYKDIIEVMQEKGDERHLNSDFLKFIKKLDNGDIKINEKTNDVEVIKDSTIQNSKLSNNEEDEMNQIFDNLKQQMFDFETPKEGMFLQDNPYMSQENVDLVNTAKEEINQHRSQDARYALEAEVQKQPDNSEAWLMLGKIHTENDRDDLAMKCFKTALEVDPFNADALLLLGISCTNEFGEFEAMVHLKNWIKIHNDYHIYFDESNILLNHDIIVKEIETNVEDDDISIKWARIENLQKNFYREMLVMMENIALKHPKESNIWIALGIAHFIPHESERAIDCFREAVKLNPQDHNAWNKLGAILAHSRMNEDAIHTYQKALDLKPDYPRCWANLGIAHMSKESYENATRCFVKALQIYPHINDVWDYLRSTMEGLGRYEMFEWIYKRDLDTLIKKMGL
jgi:Flp pilus assembly protein TadD